MRIRIEMLDDQQSSQCDTEISGRIHSDLRQVIRFVPGRVRSLCVPLRKDAKPLYKTKATVPTLAPQWSSLSGQPGHRALRTCRREGPAAPWRLQGSGADQIEI